MLTDNDPMPRGEYEGTKMANVPASYLIWLLGRPWFEDSQKWRDVRDYIADNLQALKEEVTRQGLPHFCVRCMYEITSMPSTNRCPKCGEDAWDMTHLF